MFPAVFISQGKIRLRNIAQIFLSLADQKFENRRQKGFSNQIDK